MPDAIPPKLVVGLGNPGEKYRHTRHNLGAEAVALAARRLNLKLSHSSLGARWGRGRAEDVPVICALPKTYMNLSGRAAAALSRYFKVPADNLLVVSDDLNLPLGRLRLRSGGSAGGHNGLQSVIDLLGTMEFARLRIGLGSPTPEADQVEFVLSRPAAAERPVVEESLARAAEAIRVWLLQGLEAAMRSFN